MKKLFSILIVIAIFMMPALLMVGCGNEKITAENCEISQYPFKSEYYVDELIDLTGAKINVTYSDNSTKEFNAVDFCDLTTIDMSQAGQKKIDCVYKYKENIFTLFFYINVREKENISESDQVYLDMIKQMERCRNYSFSGNVFGDEPVSVDFIQSNNSIEVKIENEICTGILKGSDMYISYATGEKYKSQNVSYSEFTKLVNFNMGSDNVYPMQIILFSLNMAKNDTKSLIQIDSGYKLTFSHINTSSTNGPHLPTGFYTMFIDTSKKLTKVEISSGELNGSISFAYNRIIEVDESQYKLVNEHFYAIKNSIAITGAKTKWDINIFKHDGPENYYYEKVDGKEYFAYKRVNLGENEEDCYYFYEDGKVYYIDRLNNVNYKWGNVSANDFCAFVNLSNKINMISDFLARFDVNEIEANTITYNECYSLDYNDSSIRYESHVYSCYAKVNLGNGQAERKYIVFEIDGGSQLRNVYIYDTKEEAAEDANYSLSSGQINGWGAQNAGETCQIYLQINFYQNELPTVQYILDHNGINFADLNIIDKTGQALQK